MALIKIGDYANGTFIDRDEWVAELNNIYGTWNGNNPANDVHHKFSGANPSLIVDQIGAGLITDFRKGGLSSCPIANDGKITNANVLVRKAEWHLLFAADVFDGSNPQLLLDLNKFFIFPSGNSMRVTKFSLVFRDVLRVGGGTSVASVDNITFQLQLPSGTPVGSGIRIGGSNLTADTEYSESLNVSVSANTKARIVNTVLLNRELEGTELVQLRITLFVEWEQRLG